MKKKEQAPLDFNAAKEKALRLLAFRAHSEYEIADKLRRAGAENEYVIDAVLEFLREYKLVDDYTYAERLAADMMNLKKFGKRRIMAELSRKGISREISSAVAEELDADEEEMLLPLMEKKLGGDFDRKSRDRAFRYFAARGYSFDDIKHAFETVASQECEED